MIAPPPAAQPPRLVPHGPDLSPGIEEFLFLPEGPGALLVDSSPRDAALFERLYHA